MNSLGTRRTFRIAFLFLATLILVLVGAIRLIRPIPPPTPATHDSAPPIADHGSQPPARSEIPPPAPPAETPPPPPPLPVIAPEAADLSGDGLVNRRDYTLMMRILAGAQTPNSPLSTQADLNHDGRVDPLDAKLLMERIEQSETGTLLPPE